MTFTCFACDAKVEATETDCGPWVDDGGLWFDATGGWPSAFFDPDENGVPQGCWEVLRIFICDDCLARKRMRLNVVRYAKRSPEQEDLGPYDSGRAWVRGKRHGEDR